MTDTFTGWTEGFPTWTEKTEEKDSNKLKKKKKRKKERKENGSMKSVQDLACSGHYKVTSFTSKVTQRVSKTLGITYYLHCAWRP